MIGRLFPRLITAMRAAQGLEPAAAVGHADRHPARNAAQPFRRVQKVTSTASNLPASQQRGQLFGRIELVIEQHVVDVRMIVQQRSGDLD